MGMLCSSREREQLGADHPKMRGMVHRKMSTQGHGTLNLVKIFCHSLPNSALKQCQKENAPEGSNEIVVELDSDEQMITQGALALGLIGVVVFLTTGVLGMEVSQVRPWHGGGLVSGALCITGYLWHGSGVFAPEDYGMILAFCGIMTLAPCIAYRE